MKTNYSLLKKNMVDFNRKLMMFGRVLGVWRVLTRGENVENSVRHRRHTRKSSNIANEFYNREI